MIIRDAEGNTKIVPDRFVRQVRTEGISSLESQKMKKVPPEQFEAVTKKPGEIKRGPIGSLIEGTSIYGIGDDTEIDYEARKKIRRLLIENPAAYVYCYDIPKAALYSPRPPRIVKQDWQTSDEGANHIKEWLQLFEARKHQVNLTQLLIDADFYYRLYGEVLGEVRYLRNDYLHEIGYVNNEMIGRIDFISPALLNEVKYERTTGNLKSLTMIDRDGLEKEFKGKELRHFIYFHNMPANEKRGLTRLRVMRPWLNNFDDLLEMTLEMHYNDARPIEQHKMNEEGLLPDEITEMWTDHEERIKDAIGKGQRMIMTNDRVDIELKGMQGRALDSGQIIDRVKDYNYQSFRLPQSLVEAKNANKATIEEQVRHWHETQLEAEDRACAIRLACGEIFPRVLETRGVDPRLVPMIVFPPFTPANELERSMVWQVQADTFGNSRMRQIADEQGFDSDMEVKLERKNGQVERTKERMMDQSWGDS